MPNLASIALGRLDRHGLYGIGKDCLPLWKASDIARLSCGRKKSWVRDPIPRNHRFAQLFRVTRKLSGIVHAVSNAKSVAPLRVHIFRSRPRGFAGFRRHLRPIACFHGRVAFGRDAGDLGNVFDAVSLRDCSLGTAYDVVQAVGAGVRAGVGVARPKERHHPAAAGAGGARAHALREQPRGLRRRQIGGVERRDRRHPVSATGQDANPRSDVDFLKKPSHVLG